MKIAPGKFYSICKATYKHSFFRGFQIHYNKLIFRFNIFYFDNIKAIVLKSKSHLFHETLFGFCKTGNVNVSPINILKIFVFICWLNMNQTNPNNGFFHF